MPDVQDGGQRYSFSDRGLAVVVWILCVIALLGIFLGLANQQGGIPQVSVVFISAFVIGFVVSSLGLILPSRMTFGDYSVKVNPRWRRKTDDISYSQLTRVDVIRVDGRAGYSYKVALHVLGRSKLYEVPKRFRGASIAGPESAEALNFADWVKRKANLGHTRD